MLYRIFSSQYCPNTSETTLHKKIPSEMLAQSTDMFLQENNLYNVVLIQHCTKQLPTQCRNIHQRCSVKKVFLKILHCSQENTCVLVCVKLQHRFVPVNIAKFLRPTILKNICKRLLLKMFLHSLICCVNMAETTMHKKITCAKKLLGPGQKCF